MTRRHSCARQRDKRQRSIKHLPQMLPSASNGRCCTGTVQMGRARRARTTYGHRSDLDPLAASPPTANSFIRSIRPIFTAVGWRPPRSWAKGSGACWPLWRNWSSACPLGCAGLIPTTGMSSPLHPHEPQVQRRCQRPSADLLSDALPPVHPGSP